MMLTAQQRIDTIRQAYREFESATGTLIECGCEPKSIKELVDIIDRANTPCAGMRAND